MNILVTGGKGQLGLSLQKISHNYLHHIFYFTDLPELDITDEVYVDNYVKTNKIDLIVNCAAYTAVDKAENDKELAYRINCTGPAVLAKVSKTNNIQLIHISTDYVFCGESCHPLKENDTPSPNSVYGSTKLAGEKAIEESYCNATIIRTAWLYSEFGNNFVKTMLRLATEKPSINVVYDQIGTPTYATDLAKAIMTISDNLHSGFEIYHFTDEGVISWYDFTKTIFEISGIHNVKVNAIESSLFPSSTKRPSYSVLAKDKIKAAGVVVPYWRDSLANCIKLLNK